MGRRDKIMVCGHKVYDYELMKSDDTVYIRYYCFYGCSTEWETVGPAPDPEDMEVL